MFKIDNSVGLPNSRYENRARCFSSLFQPLGKVRTEPGAEGSLGFMFPAQTFPTQHTRVCVSDLLSPAWKMPHFQFFAFLCGSYAHRSPTEKGLSLLCFKGVHSDTCDLDVGLSLVCCKGVHSDTCDLDKQKRAGETLEKRGIDGLELCECLHTRKCECDL